MPNQQQEVIYKCLDLKYAALHQSSAKDYKDSPITGQQTNQTATDTNN